MSSGAAFLDITCLLQHQLIKGSPKVEDMDARKKFVEGGYCTCAYDTHTHIIILPHIFSQFISFFSIFNFLTPIP